MSMERDNHPFSFEETEVTELVAESQVLLGVSDSTAQVSNQYWDGVCQNRSKGSGEDEHFNVILGGGGGSVLS